MVLLNIHSVLYDVSRLFTIIECFVISSDCYLIVIIKTIELYLILFLEITLEILVCKKSGNFC